MRSASAVCLSVAVWMALSSCAATNPQNGVSDTNTESLREECVAGGMIDLDAEIIRLEWNAKASPELYIDVAERLYRKAEMYRLQVEELERMRERDHREEWKVMCARDEALEKALTALEKVPGKVYPDTDVRLLKALIYIALERIGQAMSQLEELAEDTQANPALRRQAGRLLSKFDKGR